MRLLSLVLLAAAAAAKTNFIYKQAG